ncbi:hypothetical protein BpHYR1_027683 [Brachionus plicatilis]|uniref:Uncharacterized protein n=1 Tax=Brachionus plicatilis TaxID=10195 RepID=A0A3M7QUP3_BRAPC|nr:hypothetical protein BpHYR1_027683 [Brachionus plicatilis]
MFTINLNHFQEALFHIDPVIEAAPEVTKGSFCLNYASIEDKRCQLFLSFVLSNSPLSEHNIGAPSEELVVHGDQFLTHEILIDNSYSKASYLFIHFFIRATNFRLLSNLRKDISYLETPEISSSYNEEAAIKLDRDLNISNAKKIIEFPIEEIIKSVDENVEFTILGFKSNVKITSSHDQLAVIIAVYAFGKGGTSTQKTCEHCGSQINPT